MDKLLYEELTYKIIGAGQEVYKELGPGYLESVYEDALCYELNSLNIDYQRQLELDVHYKDVIFEHRFRADLLVDKKVLVENKAIKKITLPLKQVEIADIEITNALSANEAIMKELERSLNIVIRQ